ncbi:hypothetical protein [Chryseobacterium sp. M5A1_1a]
MIIKKEDTLKQLELLYAHNKYLYKEKKLISKKEYISNSVKIINKITSLIIKEEDLVLMIEALKSQHDVSKFRAAIHSLSFTPN